MLLDRLDDLDFTLQQPIDHFAEGHPLIRRPRRQVALNVRIQVNRQAQLGVRLEELAAFGLRKIVFRLYCCSS